MLLGPLLGAGNGHGRRPAALRSASLILVCQPGPVARTWASTSGSRRSVVNSLGAAAFGRPPRRALANHSSVSSGTSTASQSSWLMWSGLGGVVAAFFPVIGFPQSDDARVAAARRPHHHMQARADVADGDEAVFAVVPAIIHGGQRGFPVEPFGGGEVHA